MIRNLCFLISGLALQASPIPVLSSVKATELQGPFYVQPFAGLTINPDGSTSPFFSDLPDGSYLGNRVVNILGNMQGFDSLGNPMPFSITGVQVTQNASTFSPAFGLLDFNGLPSLTLQDSLDPDQVTFSSADLTLAFQFVSDPSLSYSYTLLTKGLPEGSFLLYDDAETTIPEPATWMLLASTAAFFAFVKRRR